MRVFFGNDLILSNEEDCINTRKNYSDIDFSMRFTQKNGQNNYGIFLAKESDEDFSKGREFIALRGKTKINSKTLGYMVTNVENDFLGTKSTVNVFDYINVRSEKLTTYADILTTKKERDSGKGFRLQYTNKPTKVKGSREEGRRFHKVSHHGCSTIGPISCSITDKSNPNCFSRKL